MHDSSELPRITYQTLQILEPGNVNGLTRIIHKTRLYDKVKALTISSKSDFQADIVLKHMEG
jgi:hypothetical protein